MKNLKICPSSLSGQVHIPPSKSQTMRAILFASLAKGTSKITNYLKSPDIDAMISGCRQVGAEISIDKHCLTITGTSGRPLTPSDIINAGNSGQVLRFFGAACGLISGYTVITGDNSIRTNRPITELLSGLNQLSATAFSTQNNSFAPFIVKGPIQPGTIGIDGTLSQHVSAFIIAASFLNGETEIKVTNPGETPWVDVTLSWLDRLGIKYINENYSRYTIYGSSENNAFDYVVPGDFSSAAYPIIASLITGSEITLLGLDMQDSQGDKKLIPTLESLGANIEYDSINKTLHVLPSELTGADININDFNDAVTILAVLGCYAKGTTTISGAHCTRFKESDRLAVMVKELGLMGANISETNDGLIIKQTALNGKNLNSHNDHRVAMSLAVAGFGAKNNTLVNGVDCIDKSFPTFVQSMSELGANIKYIQ